MISWSAQRKIIYLAVALGLILILFFIFIFPRLRTTPTCFDGKQNGGEAGIDCGGNCALFCSATALDMSILWARPFKVIDGRYNVLALVENQNTDTALASIAYEFRLYDENNVFITRKTGTTYILPNNKTAIFEAGLDTGSRIATRAEFSFIEQPLWLQTPKLSKGGFSVSSSDITLKDVFIKPSLTATIKNNSKYDLFDFDVIAILYNQNNGVISASRTFIEQLNKDSDYTAFFTWQEGFSEEPVRIEILPQVNVFGVGAYR